MSRVLAAVFCGAVTLGLAYGQPRPAPTGAPAPRPRPLTRITANSLRGHVSFLASDVLEGRDTPGSGGSIAAEYIASQFRSAGLAEGAPGFFQLSEKEEYKDSRGRTRTVEAGQRNVVGVIRGLKDEYVLLTAHYDHVGLKKEGEGDLVFNGANDNASSIAALIEIARTLASRPQKPRRTIVFIAYFGEEKGLVGSRYYARHPLFPIAQTVTQLNMEQLGRTDDSAGPRVHAANLTGFSYSNLPAILARAARRTGLRIEDPGANADAFFERSDNEALAKLGVPAHTLSVAYEFPDYHKVTDEWSKLDYDNMALVANGIAEGALALANGLQVPKWNAANPKVQPFVEAWKATHSAESPAASAPRSSSSRATRPLRLSKQSQAH